MPVNVDPDHLAEELFVRLFHCQVTLFLPLHIVVFFWKEVTMWNWFWRNRKLHSTSLRAKLLMPIIWKSAWEISLFSYMYSIIYLYQCRLIDIYFILWGIIPKYNFIMSLKLLYFWPLEAHSCILWHNPKLLYFWPLEAHSCILWHNPITVGLFYFLALPFWHNKILQTPFLYFLTDAAVSHFSKKSGSFYWKTVWGTKICASFYIIVSFRFQENHFLDPFS